MYEKVSTILITICLIGEFAGCRANVAEVGTRNITMMEERDGENGRVSLNADIGVENGRLSVNYKLKNTTKSPIYVFDRLWEFAADGSYAEAPMPVYILLRDDRTLHIVKGLAALPRTRRVEMRLIPFATKVEPGGELSGKFELPEPVDEYNPYFVKDASSKTEPSTSQNILFSMHYINAAEDLEVKEAALPGALSLWKPTLLQDVQLLSSGPKFGSLKILRRTDSFERF